MGRRVFPRWLAGAVLCSALAAILGALFATHDPRWQWLHWLAKPLTTALIFLLAWRVAPWVSPRYRRWILLGIACSLLGDVLLMLPQDLFVPGLLAFLLAHGCFIAGLLDDSRFAARPLAWLACLAYGALNLVLLWPSLPAPLRPPVIVYVLVLASMGGQALGRAWLHASRHDDLAMPARRAASGALLFLLSDTLLAWDHFHAALPWAPVWILGSYYAAQWQLARSVQRVVPSLSAMIPWG